jgi:hypothetical protein
MPVSNVRIWPNRTYMPPKNQKVKNQKTTKMTISISVLLFYEGMFISIGGQVV